MKIKTLLLFVLFTIIFIDITKTDKFIYVFRNNIFYIEFEDIIWSLYKVLGLVYHLFYIVFIVLVLKKAIMKLQKIMNQNILFIILTVIFIYITISNYFIPFFIALPGYDLLYKDPHNTIGHLWDAICLAYSIFYIVYFLLYFEDGLRKLHIGILLPILCILTVLFAGVMIWYKPALYFDYFNLGKYHIFGMFFIIYSLKVLTVFD
jgi:hypothetical protein